MATPEILKSVQFLVDEHGKPLAVQIGIREWEKLLDWLEDQEDRALVKDALERLRAAPVPARALAWEKVQAEWSIPEADRGA